MPGHYGRMSEGAKKAMKKVMNNSVENKMTAPKKKKMNPMKIFEKKPPNSHLMGNVVMSGKTHSKDSKVLGKMASKASKGGKGSKEMKDKMAKLRAMRKKK
tara:strand:+ start:292 stop:594 length:303 start_codon:yes stop_codon:yes gene_type:complete